MNFQSLAKVEKPDFYIEVAFTRARETVKQTKSTFQDKKLTREQKSRFIELEKVKAFSKSLSNSLKNILISFPSIDGLAEFYNALVKFTLDYEMLKKSLGAVNWATQQIQRIEEQQLTKMRICKDLKAINEYSRQAYGRIASVIKQIKKNLEDLETARQIMKEYPSIKTSIPTIVIAGFPNTGKTTLLKALTGSAPKIAPYPFTTQQLMIGYTEINKEKIQIIDTPGLLDRPFSKRNAIEKQAVLAIKYLATKILFVADPTEYCGYTLEEQTKLMYEIKKEFKIEMIIILNKIDKANKEQIEKAKSKLKNAIEISADKNVGMKDVLDKIQNNLNTVS